MTPAISTDGGASFRPVAGLELGEVQDLVLRLQQSHEWAAKILPLVLITDTFHPDSRGGVAIRTHPRTVLTHLVDLHGGRLVLW